HGKTTTSAMIVTALEAAGFEPSYAIGSELTGRGSGARLGGDIWVIEADESDGSFLNYSPELAVVTNIEFDHADFYPDPEAYFEAFAAFAGRIRPSGRLIACAADKGADALMERLRAAPSGPAVTAYGAAGGWRDLGLAGDHLALNAEAAGLAAQAFGADPALVRAGLAAFAGAARRFEPRGRAGGVAVYDDYAHHPTEIAATLAAARRLAGTSGRLLVVFQPHLYSRTKQFAAAFGRALGAADRVWLLDVYGAREAPMAGVDSGLIASAMPGGAAALARDRAAVPPAVAAAARPGDIVLTMGAGDVTELGPAIVAELEARG
ncbi:MAG: hypothetical protein LBD70_08190, partial [Bifidobacteriaceae bacterium]|nr:hypothetical protein [Bifidobacteriaceae bacterium]